MENQGVQLLFGLKNGKQFTALVPEQEVSRILSLCWGDDQEQEILIESMNDSSELVSVGNIATIVKLDVLYDAPERVTVDIQFKE